jgi:hypothetical protein
MAEEQNSPYTMDAYNPFFTERKWTPFYKRYTFTGASQADQAANLITSPSFQNFWSGGGSQADYTTGVRVDSLKRDAELGRHPRRRNIDFKPNIPAKPQLPTPPPHIRPIQLDQFGYPLTQNPMRGISDHLGLGATTAAEMAEGGMFVPAKFQDIWPHMSAEEQAWWHERTRGIGKGNNYNNLVANWQASKNAVSEVPIDLRDIRGALPRDQRMLVNTLNYGMDANTVKYMVDTPSGRFDDKTLRLVNASSPSNMAGVSEELSQFTGDTFKSGRYVPPSVRHRSGIMLLSSTSPDLPLALHESRSVLAEAQQIRNEYDAMRSTENWMTNTAKQPFTRPSPLPATTYLDIPEVNKDPFPVNTATFKENARRVGTITPLEINGDTSRATRTTVYGPPVKGMGVETALNNTLHYGGKVLGVAGGVLEGTSVPRRSYELINDFRRMKGEPIMTQPYDINRYPDASAWEIAAGTGLGILEAQANFITLGVTDSMIHPEWRHKPEPVQRGFYSDSGQRVPSWVPNYQSTLIDRNRYQRQGVSFDHIYPQAPR